MSLFQDFLISGNVFLECRISKVDAFYIKMNERLFILVVDLNHLLMSIHFLNHLEN